MFPSNGGGNFPKKRQKQMGGGPLMVCINFKEKIIKIS